ncbi:protein spaetzle 5-like isoform X2 [Centruroides sculpturatus]|uniref:protein spaetzle 5-like isoform X2 n=2 Tax=Centruroides sculpturatus TaxID=218467 RepID=UPI000C6C9A3F|nr:protein spaetzle 5-like isoform X2 [Centruroides sculpturatus]
MIVIKWLMTAVVAQRIVYPEEGRRPSGYYSQRLSPPRIRCDPRDTYCETVSNYPLKEILGAVNGSFFRSLGRREGDRPAVESRRRPTEADSEETRVCRVNRRLVFPKAAKDKNGIWRFLIDDERAYRQPVLIEKCGDEGGPCSAIQDNLGPGFKTRCAQKYISKLMMAFDENSLRPFSEDFQFPVACVCYVRNRFYPLSSP